MGDITQERFQTGNHVRVYLTGDDSKKILGDGTYGGAVNKGQTTNLTSSTGARGIYIIGDPDPQEIVDTQHGYTVRLDMLRLRSEDSAQLINAGPVEIEMVDRFNSKLLGVAHGAKIADASMSIPANQVLVRNITFQALSITGG
jgi:hypothetical protein